MVQKGKRKHDDDDGPGEGLRGMGDKLLVQRQRGKRRRSSFYHHRNPIFPPHLPRPSLLTLPGLPFELLAEIFSYLHPRDILSVARTNAWLCYTLVHPSASFIWRFARAENCWRVEDGSVTWDAEPVPPPDPLPDPLPDPPPQLTEPAYAALVFDVGKCDVCKEKTHRPHVSYAIRRRVCFKAPCRSSAEGLRTKPEIRFPPSTLPLQKIWGTVPHYADFLGKFRPFGRPSFEHGKWVTDETYRRIVGQISEAEGNPELAEFLRSDADGQGQIRFQRIMAVCPCI
ncbi:uncharacterized protein EI90DRAFT_780959 [Cantharellus anzutake]|uniref:uncharacterized protein n=1 Tax=Cantharellus anzutake TaxID=1750568 RepID=UPI00190377DE|nr:uncharacterized protein EI90DRAFT_780959 [Cantharellus anzutake]KAF8342739.1 hypothetical protein EI90DRAFT_780959 [Cantharellus anzutake]